jgi:hypothetical protein
MRPHGRQRWEGSCCVKDGLLPVGRNSRYNLGLLVIGLSKNIYTNVRTVYSWLGYSQFFWQGPCVTDREDIILHKKLSLPFSSDTSLLEKGISDTNLFRMICQRTDILNRFNISDNGYILIILGHMEGCIFIPNLQDRVATLWKIRRILVI